MEKIKKTKLELWEEIKEVYGSDDENEIIKISWSNELWEEFLKCEK